MTAQKVSDETVLDFIESFSAIEGYAPSVREIAEGVGVSSTSTVWNRLQSLRDAGKVTWRPGHIRTLTIGDGY